MTPSTRKRLLELWKRSPELRPFDVEVNGGEFKSKNDYAYEWIPDKLVEEATCGKLCEWLFKQHNLEVFWACAARREFLLKLDGDWDKRVTGRTLLDALLAAAEAVAGELAAKGDAMSTEHIWSTEGGAGESK